MKGYKLATVEAESGPRACILADDLLFDAAELTGRQDYASVLGILNDWEEASARLSALSLAGPARTHGKSLESARLRAPVLWPSAIYCAGANYRDHAAEMARRSGRAVEADPRENGGKPWFFLKAPRAICDPGGTVSAAKYTSKLDWEVELAAVIGVKAKDVPVAQALACIAGYTIANDLSARDQSRRANVSETSAFRADWTSQKSFDGSCPLGPWIVPAADIPDPQDLELRLSVNGNMKQHSNTRQMIFSIAEQIAHLSRGMTLYPGDLVLTGTPAGVGAARDEYLLPGDTVTLDVERIGTLHTRIV